MTQSTIRGSIERDLSEEVFIRDELAFLGAYHGDWDEVAESVVDLSTETGQRIAVATLDDKILADSELLRFDQSAPLPAQATIVDPASELFEFAVSDATLELLYEQMSLIEECLDDAGIPNTVIIDDFGFEEIEPEGPLTSDQEDIVDDCFISAEEAIPLGASAFTLDSEDDVDSLAAEPLQLFIGYGGETEASLFPSGVSAGFWAAIGGVLAVAIALTVMVASRITRPIVSLTEAARQMRGGDLGARVEVAGGDELAELGRAFNEMAASIQAEDRARRTLTTDVAHELRSPLANLRGYLEAVQDGVVDPDEATINSLHEETMTLQILVDDLQQLSLAETGRLALVMTEVDLGDLVERTVATNAGSAANANVQLEAVTEPNMKVMADGDRVRQILTNLIANAIRHTPGGQVVVTIVADDESHPAASELGVEVRDNGEGIEAVHLPHLFDRFYRADQSRTRSTGGTGLGLAIAQELAQANGGRIEVESVVGQGSTFRLILPRPR
ncbi:MAG: HAMP domain-containing protein [Actinomycetia bacterium]|nr:HAMP domain-containing protein [Actinomycetes bacterium]